MSRLVSMGIVLCSLGCSSAVATRVATAANAHEVPDDLVVTYDDYHLRWGGNRITVRSDGAIAIRRWRPGQSESTPLRSEGRVDPSAVQQLVRLLADIEAWEQRETADSDRVDDARARLTIRVGDAQSRIWEWANDVEANRRIMRVRDHLRALAFEARHPTMRGGLLGDRE